LLVAWIQIRVEVIDDYRLHAIGDQLLGGRPDDVLVKGRHHLPRRLDVLVDLLTVAALNERSFLPGNRLLEREIV